MSLWRRLRRAADAGEHLPPPPHPAPEAARIAVAELAPQLYAVALRVYRVCQATFFGGLALMLASLAAGVTGIGTGPAGRGAVHILPLAAILLPYGLLFALFAYGVISAHFVLDSLPRQALFMTRGMARDQARRADAMPPEEARAPAPLRPILAAPRHVRAGTPLPSVAASVRRRVNLFTAVWTATPILAFLPNVIGGGDPLMGLTGIAVWAYFCFTITHDGLRYVVRGVDDSLRQQVPAPRPQRVRTRRAS